MVIILNRDRIDGDNIYLQLMTEEDTDDIIRWRNNPNIREKFIFRELFTRETHQRWINNQITKHNAVQFIIFEKDGNRKIGSVYLRDIDQTHHKAEYGIFIGENDAQGKGFGTETAGLMIDYAFHELNLHRIFLRVYANNVQAIRSYEKAGFVEEACLRNDVRIDGSYRDMLLMAIVNEEGK
ncbi:MAG: UDP-4-amino-4,6-dideoxy-N-acetyl-beta-L-altrosamine N-acetyltransferase [Lachnospiraceae bacterium]|nr:UDP-4-amino-4,6-dideoxy-N-acetyl-beta-L-altrosamine N-acetyltransferase [Lachnospiraceae bacterium]